MNGTRENCEWQSSNQYLMTIKVADSVGSDLLQRISTRTLLRIAKRQKTTLFDFSCGGVLRRGFYWNGVEQPLHLHYVFRSLHELKVKAHFSTKRNRHYLSTAATRKFSGKSVQIDLIRCWDEGGAEYAVSPSKNPDYHGVLGGHFCPSRKRCPVCRTK